MVDEKHGVKYKKYEKLWKFLTKRIKSDFLKEVILAIKVNQLVMEPHFMKIQW